MQNIERYLIVYKVTLRCVLFLVMAGGSVTTFAAETLHYTEGAELRVSVKEGQQASLTIFKPIECDGRPCVQVLVLEEGVKVEDYRSGSQQVVEYQDLLDWGVFYGEVEYVTDEAGNARASIVARTKRPSSK